MKLERCPVCHLKDAQLEQRLDHDGMFAVSCPRCHDFITSLRFMKANEGDGWTELSLKRHLLSGLVRELNERKEEVPTVLTGNVEKLLAHPYIPQDADFKAKSRKLLAYIKAGTPRYRHELKFNILHDIFTAYAKDPQELGGILALLLDDNLVEYRTPESKYGDKQRPVEEIISLVPVFPSPINLMHVDPEIYLRLTTKGWDLVREFGKKPSESKQGFVAIRFDPLDATDDVDACINAISAGISKAGYEPKCIKTIVFSDAIMNKALADISQSKFVIVDLTGNRTAVAFEAGYARALGIDAVYVYQTSRGKPHNFYAGHYQLLPYEKPEELAEIVYNAISSYYPR